MGEYMARMAIDGSRSKVYRATSTTGNGHRGSIAGEDMLLLLLQTLGLLSRAALECPGLTLVLKQAAAGIVRRMKNP